MSGIRLGTLTKPNCDILAASFADDLADEFSTFDILVLDINIFHKQENTNFLTATCTVRCLERWALFQRSRECNGYPIVWILELPASQTSKCFGYLSFEIPPLS